MPKTPTGYLHGYSEEERVRLRRAARLIESIVHDGLPYEGRKQLLEVGCGVGAQMEILLQRFPELHVTGVDKNDDQLAEAKRLLATVPSSTDRYTLVKGDAMQLDYGPESFDAAYLSWFLEHVGDPARVLSEVRRVLASGSPVACTEVLNATFFIDPHGPDTLRYWTAYNEHQLSVGGDPFVGAKLGNLLQSAGFRDVRLEVKSFHADNRNPVERDQLLALWSDLLFSGAPALLAARRVEQSVVDGMRQELARAASHPDCVFFYAFIQARARVP